jgi:hypothetical protein
MLAAIVLSLTILFPAAGAATSTPVDPAWSALIAADAAERSYDLTATGFALVVRPGVNGFPGGAFPGQHCLLLVAVRPADAAWRGSVEVTATAPGAVVRVQPERLAPGVVGEITVVPKATTAERSITVTVRATRGAIVAEAKRTIEIYPEQDLARPWARQILGRFLPWLEARYPELGLGPDSRFFGTVTRPHWLIVMHYLFLNRDWEIGVQWHVMIEPYDWARIYLRPRWTSLRPTFAAEITSVQRGDRPHAIAPTMQPFR